MRRDWIEKAYYLRQARLILVIINQREEEIAEIKINRPVLLEILLTVLVSWSYMKKMSLHFKLASGSLLLLEAIITMEFLVLRILQ